MIVNVVKNTILISTEDKKVAINAYLNFERVLDSEDLTGEVGILPIFSIYAMILDTSEESKNIYKDMYKELLVIMGALFPEPYYINNFESVEKIYTLKEGLLEQTQGTKLPHLTTMKLYKD